METNTRARFFSYERGKWLEGLSRGLFRDLEVSMLTKTFCMIDLRIKLLKDRTYQLYSHTYF